MYRLSGCLAVFCEIFERRKDIPESGFPHILILVCVRCRLLNLERKNQVLIPSFG